MPDPLPFLPGSSSSAARGAIIQRAEPLARYLPPVGNGVISAWLHRQVSPGAWILDPFGAAPRLAIESARVGYRVLVAINNPIARFLLEMAADPPPLSELQAALAELASAFKGSERIEPLIRSLYQTDCSHCGHAITADAFLWEKGAEAPYGRIYRCPNCGDTGERPTSRADTDRSAQIGSAGLHRARALERIAPPHDPDRIHAEEALEAYLPRAVYALFTLFNKLDGLELSPLRRRCLHALLLSACDQGNTLWAHPTARERPRQIIIPTRFRENNIWLSLEKAIETWQANPGQPDKIPLMLWPEQPPPTGGICMFEGRLKDLAGSLKDHLPIQAVAAALPRPNQAYWTLCALWAGWLWGREAIGPFKSVLRRRRYDWSWHTSALHAALSYLAPVLSSGTPFLGLIGEAEPQFLIAALAAADASGFALQNLALRPESAQAQITWQREDGPSSTAQASSTLEAAIEIAHQQAADLLRQIGEPITYLPMFTAGLGGLARARHFWLMHASWQKIPTTTKDAQPHAAEVSPADLFARAQSAIRSALTYRSGFARFNASEADQPESPTENGITVHSTEPQISETESREKGGSDSSETGLWWLREPLHTITPLADRIEVQLVNYLIQHPGITLAELDQMLCTAFPGLLAPDIQLLQAILESYAEPLVPGSSSWQIRPQDQPAARRSDLSEARKLINRLGERLGYQPQQSPPATTSSNATLALPPAIIWAGSTGEPSYWLFPLASAVIGDILLRSTQPPARSIIVLPGGRANLVLHKLRRDPRLNRLCTLTNTPSRTGGWRFLKFRHLRWLFENPLLSPESLDEQIYLDPLTYSTPQLRLL